MNARRAWKLPVDGVLVLISCGSLGFGAVQEAVDAALAADPRCCVLVMCGHNTALRRRLLARPAPSHRLTVLGWVPDTAAVTAMVDVVVNNAGGVTATEAIACGRALVMFRPLAGHGRASAQMLADEGLATVCHRGGELTELLRGYVRAPERLAQAHARARTHARAHDLRDLVAALPRRDVSALGAPSPSGTADRSPPPRPCHHDGGAECSARQAAGGDAT